MARTFDITKRIMVWDACSNIDSLYGPYNSINDALETLGAANSDNTFRAIGRTVGIIENGAIVEYWFKTGINDNDLVRKIESQTLIMGISDESPEQTVDENGEIYISFNVTGNIGINKAILYRVVNNNEIAEQEFTTIGKNSVNTIQIKNPAISGIYTYHIKIIDMIGNYASTESGDNYLEYVVRYGGISTTYNFTQLSTIKIKNYETVANNYFLLNISVRDNTFEIISVNLSDINDPNPSCQPISLQPQSSPNVISETFIGNNYYFLPDANALEPFDGKKCSIVIVYNENNVEHTKVIDIFTLLKTSTVNFVSETPISNYYINIPAYYKFQLQTGVENISVTLTPNDESDFTFEMSTVYAYRSYSLKIIPKNIEKNNAKLIINWGFNYNNRTYTGTIEKVAGNIMEITNQSCYEPNNQETSTALYKIIESTLEHHTNIENSQYYTIVNDLVTEEFNASSFILDMYCKINQQNVRDIKYLTITYGGTEIASINEDEISCINVSSTLTTDTPLNEWTQISIGINLGEKIVRNSNDLFTKYHGIYINGMIVKNAIFNEYSEITNYDSNKRLVVTVGNGIYVQKCFLYYESNGLINKYIYPNIDTNFNNSIVYNNYKAYKFNFTEPTDLPVLKLKRIIDTDQISTYYRVINAYKDEHEEDLIKYVTIFGTIGLQKATKIDEYDPRRGEENRIMTDPSKNTEGTLFRQSVDIKKPAQKEYAVICEGEWIVDGVNILEGIIIEVHTQGTSTLVYSIPNFKFTFWSVIKNENNEIIGVEHYCPHFIVKDENAELEDDKYYKEYIYTAKADFMDSSHLNNTPTCNYYNNLIQNLIKQNIIVGSPSARNGGLDAIMGFPIIMEISDTAGTFSDSFSNIGSFMLNIDKTGESLNFEVDENGQHLSCISFEGTSNDNEHGAAGRFDIPEDTELKSYIKLKIKDNYEGEIPQEIIDNIDTGIYNENTIYNGQLMINFPYIDIDIDKTEIKNDYNQIKNAIKNSNKNLDPESYIYPDNDISNGILVKNHPYVKWCKFLSDGLEYRYPDTDIYKTNDNSKKSIKKVMDVVHFMALYRVWSWVYISDKLTEAKYKEGFAKRFDVDYCKLYFIQLMIYAQTDNLGKNAMFDCWGVTTENDGEIEYDFDNSVFYPRPYDLDSEAGVDNNGNDNVATFVEIMSKFSLTYDNNKTLYDLASEYLIDHNIKTDEFNEILGTNYTFEQITQYKNNGTGITEPHAVLVNLKNNNLLSCKDDIIIPASTIKYGTQTYDRYHFSSNTSKLWINFYRNYRLDIRTFYSNLKANANYNYQSIIELCKTCLIDKLGVNQYNQDFINKYLANSDQRLAYGNRWYKFKKWITKRFAFCDSYFNAYQSALYSTVSQFNYFVRIDSPQYVSHQYQEKIITRFVIDQTSFSAGSGSATKLSLNVNQGSVFETDLFKYVTRDNGDANFSNLLSLNVSGNKNVGFDTIESVVGSDLNNLKYLDISDSNISILNVPQAVKILIAENVTLNALTFAENCQVEEIRLKNSTLNGEVSFSNLTSLKTLDLSNCTFKQGIVFERLPILSQLIFDNTAFENTITIQDGVNITNFDFSGLSLSTISFSGSNLQIDTINFHNTTFSNDTLNINAIGKNIKNLYFNDCKGLKFVEYTYDTQFENLECLSIANSSIESFGPVNGEFDCSKFININEIDRVTTYRDNGTVVKTNESTLNVNPRTGIVEGYRFTFENTRIKKIVNINWNGVGNNLFNNCMYLTSISGTINLHYSINRLFAKCYSLITLPTININTDVISAQYTLAATKSLNYSIIASVIKKCTNVINFTGVCNRVYYEQDTDIKINLNELFGNNHVVQILDHAFTGYNILTETTNHPNYKSINNAYEILGSIPSTCTSAVRMFWLANSNFNLTIPYDILSTATSLVSCNAMFAQSNITFTPHIDAAHNINVQLPFVTIEEQISENEYRTVNVTLNNLITKDFFPTNNSFENINLMFYATNVMTNDTELFRNMENLKRCDMMFAGVAPKAFSFNYNNKTYYIDLNVANMWLYNKKIINISGCFMNIYTVYCTDLNFNSDISSSTIIKISSLFGLSNNTYKNDSEFITINIDKIVPKLITSYVVEVMTNGNSVGCGLFENRKILLISENNSTSILMKLSGENIRTFKNSTIYLDSLIETFNLTNINTSCNEMFQGCRLYTYNNEDNHEYTYTDRKFVDVIMPSSCSSYMSMFRNSSVLVSLPEIVAPNASTLQYMFAGCVINDQNCKIPNTYFENCYSSLTNVSYMFNDNRYIVGLVYGDRGLFENCTSLSDASYMFYNAWYLNGGIPSNIFGDIDNGSSELRSLTTLAHMFDSTLILYNVQDESNNWITTSTFKPLINLTTVESMFQNTRINNSTNNTGKTYTYRNQVNDILGNPHSIIDGAAFTNYTINNIKSLFRSSIINSQTSNLIEFRFKGFVNGSEAFYDTYIRKISDTFVENNYISSIKAVDRMFYLPGRHHSSPPYVITNLGTFINKINSASISKNNIAGNLSNDDIPEIYKRPHASYENSYQLGVSLINTSPEQSEATTGVYERCFG